MNSALQILFHLDKFITNLLNIENISKKKFSNELLKIYNKIIEQDNYKYISISNFMNILINKYNNFRVEQNDSVEFIRILLSEINNENSLITKNFVYKEFEPLNKIISEIREEYNNFFLTKENSFIIQLFYIQLCNEFECKYGYKIYSVEKKLDISIYLQLIITK